MSRNNDETVTIEELDRLQPELEVMFSCAAVRVRTLKAEIAALTNAEENKAEIKPVSLVLSLVSKLFFLDTYYTALR